MPGDKDRPQSATTKMTIETTWIMKKNHWRQTGIPPDGFTIEPADGRWSWAVLIGCCFAAMIVSNAFISFGVLLPDLNIILEGTSVSTLSLAPSIAMSLSCFTGPMAAILMQTYSCRKTVFTGGLVTSCGFSLLYFVNNTKMLLVVYGIFVGIGTGLIFPSLPVIVSQYFKRHYGVAIGLVTAGTGLTKFCLIPLTELIRENYGCRGALLILGAISMHSCMGASLFQPTKWHNILVPIPHLDSNDDKQNVNTNSDELTLTIDSKASKANIKEDKLEESIGIRNKFRNFFATIDHTLLKTSVFYLGATNMVIMLASLTFSGIYMYPLGLDVGLKPMQSAMAISFRAFGEITGRATAPIVRARYNLSSRWCTIVVFTLHGILCIVLTKATSMAYFMTVGIISGLVFGCCVGLNGQLIMDNFGRKLLPSFLGLAAIVQGIATLPMGPFLGWIRDVTGTYKNVFLVISVLQFMMASLWIIRPLLKNIEIKESNRK